MEVDPGIVSKEILNDTIEKVSEAISEKFVATPIDMFIAYGMLIVLAIVPIYYGALRSVKCHMDAVNNVLTTGEKPETLSSKDAAMFPLIASCALFSLYIVFRLFSKNNVNMLLTFYFVVLGCVAVFKLFSPYAKFVPQNMIPLIPFRLRFYIDKKDDVSTEVETEETNDDQNSSEDLVDVSFTSHDNVIMAVSALVGLWYFYQKHFLANNLLGLAFSVNGIEMLHLNRIITGIILLGGLFVYDIFWVFGTDVMVTVAKNFDAPIKLVFPQDLLQSGWFAHHFAMLGLGDIVIPGIFIALLLRFDMSLKDRNGSKIYFYSGLVAYMVGILITMFVMHYFKHAQPALLYLVPTCIGIPLFVAAVKGDINLIFNYRDHPDEPATKDKES